MRVDATRTMELLASLKPQPNLAGVRLSPLDHRGAGACATPRATSRASTPASTPRRNEVVVRRSVNLGIAANTPRGLIVPNIKGADQLDLVGMAAALTVLVDKARNGHDDAERDDRHDAEHHQRRPVRRRRRDADPSAGHRSDPRASGQIAKAPWVVDDEVVVRQVVELAMAFDHRQVDGAMASAVLAHIGRFLHDPAAAIIAG